MIYFCGIISRKGYKCSDRTNWSTYFGYCYWFGDCILYTKQVVDSGPGSPSVTSCCRRGRLPPYGGGLLRWQWESGSWACILEESRRVFIMR